MENTILYRSGDFVSNKANGHMCSSQNKAYIKAMSEPAAYTGGGIYLTVTDLLKFDQALYTEELLTEENKQIMFTPVEPSRFYSYGWFIVPIGGKTVIYHNGGSGGFNSEFRRYPEKAYTIIVLSNYDGGAEALTNKIGYMLLKQPYLITTEAEAYCRKGSIMFHWQDEPEAALELYLSALKQYKKGKVEKSIANKIENGINSIAYDYLKKEDFTKAIEIFRVNTKNFSESANAYDSLAEAYMKNGQKEQAIKNYKKSLELNPDNTNAREMIDKLKN